MAHDSHAGVQPVCTGSSVAYNEAEYLKAYKRATRDPDKDNAKRKLRPSYGGKRKAPAEWEHGTGL